MPKAIVLYSTPYSVLQGIILTMIELIPKEIGMCGSFCIVLL